MSLAGWMSRNLVWTEPHRFGRRYELAADEERIAALEVLGFLRRDARLESGGRTLTFSSLGWFGSRILVADAAGATLATFRTNWLGRGTLEDRQGQVWSWRPVGWLLREYVFADESPAVRLRSRFAFLRLRIEARVESASLSEDQALIMLALGLLLMLRAQRQRHG